MSSIGKHPSSLNVSKRVGPVFIRSRYFQVYDIPLVFPSILIEFPPSIVVPSARLTIKAHSGESQVFGSSNTVSVAFFTSMRANGVSVSVI